MAITKLLKIKASKSGKASTGLGNCLKYIANPEKTDELLLTGGSLAGDPEMSYLEMVHNKEFFGKTTGTQGYHYILSLPPDEHPDTEIMRNLTEDFCKELLRDRYLFSYAVHVDRDHLHSHIVFDSVSYVDGKKWQSGKYDWLARIQPITDRLCKKYGLRSLDFKPEESKERKNKYHLEWEQEQQNLFKVRKDVSWNDIIRSDIDKVLSHSRSWPEFIKNIQNLHYDVKDGKYLSVRPTEKERYVRTARLGQAYTKEELQERLGESPKPQKTFGAPESILRGMREYLQQTGQSEITGVKVVFFQRWYAYSYVNCSKTPYKYRKELTELGKYTDRCAYAFKHSILTESDLQRHLQSLKNRVTDCKKELRRVNNQLYNTSLDSWRKLEKLRAKSEVSSEVERPEIQQQISELLQPLREHDIMAEGEKYQMLMQKKTELQIQFKQLKAESVMASDLISDFNKSKSPDDILQDPDRYTPAPFTEKSYQRITINKELFRDAPDDSDYMKFKLPGSLGNYILINKADIKMAKDESYASAYLYDHLKYKIVGSDEMLHKEIPGRDAMRYFSDRTKEIRR